jgi:hypothetical protein
MRQRIQALNEDIRRTVSVRPGLLLAWHSSPHLPRKGPRGMAYPNIFRFWSNTERLADMTERVAGRSRMAVWQRVVDHLPSLGPSEARGFIRARSAIVVGQETDRLIEQEGAKVARMRERIIEGATEALIRTIAAQLEQRSVQQAPRQAA